MPAKEKELNAMQIKNLRHSGGNNPIKVAVGGVSGLLIQITPNEAKSWVLRTSFGEWTEKQLSSGKIQRGRKKREIGLGPFPEISLKAAKERALEAKDKLAAGIDPIAEKKATQVKLMAAASNEMTFAETWATFSAEKVKEFSTDKYCQQWKRTVEIYALPDLGQSALRLGTKSTLKSGFGQFSLGGNLLKYPQAIQPSGYRWPLKWWRCWKACQDWKGRT